ncbi:unnamed protein product, partial [Allacma fusca]
VLISATPRCDFLVKKSTRGKKVPVVNVHPCQYTGVGFGRLLSSVEALKDSVRVSVIKYATGRNIN